MSSRCSGCSSASDATASAKGRPSSCRAFQAGLPTYALSNWSAETFPLARPRYPFLEWFEAIVISGEVRAAKPDERIFRHLLERHDLVPEKTVFIDDSGANVRAASALGLIAIQFEGAAALRRDLAALGLPLGDRP